MQAEATRHSIDKIKDFIHVNNVSFVGFLTLILTITVIGGSLFFAIILNVIRIIYSKLIKFYQRTHKLKPKDAVVLKNEHHPDEPQASIVPVANFQAIEPDLYERHEARSSRNQPSPVLRSKTTSQDATSNRITLDF